MDKGQPALGDILNELELWREAAAPYKTPEELQRALAAPRPKTPDELKADRDATEQAFLKACGILDRTPPQADEAELAVLREAFFAADRRYRATLGQPPING